MEEKEMNVAEETTNEEVKVDERDEQIAKLTSEVASLKDEMLRDRAELENFKRRMNEERIKERKYQNADLLTKLIDVVDNFERSLAVENYESVESFREGVMKIEKQFKTVLEGFELTEILALGEDFDPNFHQAVLTDSNPDIEDNKVTTVLQKGYMYKDRVLRPAMVKVNQK